MTRNGNRAPIEEICHRRIAQDEKIDLAVSVVGHEVGGPRGRHRQSGHHQRVVRSGDGSNPADEIHPRTDEIDVIGGVLFLAAQQTREHTRIVPVLGSGDQRAMDRVGLSRRQAALGIDLRELSQFAQRDIDDARAGFPQRSQGGIESVCYGGLDPVEHHAELAADCDACVSLAAPAAAPMGLESTGDPNCTVHVSLLGIPAISLPVLDDEGLPLGLQITGFINGDAEMFAAAASIKTLFR